MFDHPLSSQTCADAPFCAAHRTAAGPGHAVDAKTLTVGADGVLRADLIEASKDAPSPPPRFALALTALALWQVTGDGEAAEFEGWALVALYVILATLTLYE